jgi:hypothetical protein
MRWHLVCAARRSAVADAPARNGVRAWQYLLASTGGVAARPADPIRADHLRRATGLSMFGLLDYRGWPRCKLHSPRAERMREKIPVTPSA